MNPVANAIPPKPIRLEKFRIPAGLFETEIAGSCNLDAEHVASDKAVSGLSHLEVYDGGEMIVLYGASDPDHVTVLTKTPTAALLCVAAGLLAEEAD
ncbi:hypothetical protein [Shimia sediminis]|uniref:hypothetical protein n=1 Tax=Shimia sediminis TaxID=2497945 RepID=UPI000F8DE8E5|nr:hypothetical protein [Shimia sediminis]